MNVKNIKSWLRQKRILVIVALLMPVPVVAGLATSDLTEQLRAMPDASMGALEAEISGTTPSAPTGLSITVQR